MRSFEAVSQRSSSLLEFLARRLILVVLSCAVAFEVAAQVPIPLQEQINRFAQLPAAEQQALIRELQSQLPPAQRDAILGMLQQGTANAGPAPEATTPIPSTSAQTPIALPIPLIPRFQRGDTLVAEFEFRSGAAVNLPVPERQELDELLQRLQDSNPHRLDSAGQLVLPGVPPIVLAGLTVDEATVRVQAEPALRTFTATLTLLPVEPAGIEALKPFGYDLFEQVPTTFAPATDIPVPADYVVGPGDTVNVQLFGNDNQQYFLTVTREGVINFPEIGPLNVSGLSFPDVRNLIDQRIGQQMIGVRASVTLGELRSIRVFVLGDAVRPGSYTVSGLSTMTNALFASGGVKQIGSLRKIELMRGGETVTTLDLYDLLLRGDTRADARLQPGDAIFVPPIGATVSVDGEVRRPAIYELRDERTVAQVVSLAGGLTPTASRASLRLERIVPGRGTTVQDVDLTAAAGGGASVVNGDVLRVLPNLPQLENSVTLQGNVYRPGDSQWYAGMRLSNLLPSPELVKPMSDLNYVLIRRESQPNVEVEALSADLQAIWEHRPGANDLALQPRDTVYVFNLDIGRQRVVQPIIAELESQAAPNQPEPVVRVGGQVRAPGDYPLEPGMRVSDLLRAGGGLSPAAYSIEAELTRYAVVNGERRETELVPVDLAAVRRGDTSADKVLAAYDYLNVKEVPRWKDVETVTISGEVMFPGSYPIRRGELLSSVLARAGGLTDLAFPEGSVFTRVELQQRERDQISKLTDRLQLDVASISSEDPNAATARATGQSLIDQLQNLKATGRLVIRLADVVKGVQSADIVMKNGDTLLVPDRSQEVTVIGEVQYPTSHVYQAGLSREDYIAKSGGVTVRADEKRIYLVRASGEVVANADRRWFSRSGGIQVQSGDTIVVPLDVDRVRPLAKWSAVAQIIYNFSIAAIAASRL